MVFVHNHIVNEHSARRSPVQREDTGRRHDTPSVEDKHVLSQSLLGGGKLRGRGNASVRAAMLLQLQQAGGNRALQRYMHRPPGARAFLPVQRDDPVPGWSGTTGPNANPNLKVGGIRRIPIEGLTEGYQGEVPDPDKTTSKTARGQAIVLIPEAIDTTRPVDILLHLHGWGIGWRLRTRAGAEKGMEKGTVRDIALNRIEEQMEASGRGQMIGVLPQGGLHSEFGKGGGKAFDSEEYLKNVFDRLAAMKILPKREDLKIGSVVLTGHSGAGAALSTMLPNKSLLPRTMGRLAEVVLFDAINGPGELRSIKSWVLGQLDSELAAIVAEGSKAKQLEFVASKGMRFRGYYTPRFLKQETVKEGGKVKKVWLDPPTNKKPKWVTDNAGNPKWFGYGVEYGQLKEAIDRWFSDHRSKLDPEVYEKLRANYEVRQVAAGVSHEGVIGSGIEKGRAGAKDKGTLEHALSALPLQKMPPAPASRGTDGRAAHRADPSVQRAPLAIQRADPDKKQWDADWNDPEYSGARGYFSGAGRPAGTPRERYDALCPLYKAHGIPRPLQYLATEIVEVSFYGMKTPAHRDMQALLTTAENALKAMKDDKGQPRYPNAPLRQRPWALTVRTTSTGAWSNHADGRAIDMDPDTNPHLLNAKHREVITALTGIDIEKANPGDTMGLDSYDASLLASERFKASYNEEGLTKRIEELKPTEQRVGKERDELAKKLAELAKKKQGIIRERDAVLKSKGATDQERKDARKQAQTALADLEKESAAVQADLKKKNAELKEAQKPIKLLEAELKKYKAEQKKYEAAVKAVETAESSVAASDEGVKKLKAEKAALEAGKKLAEEQVKQVREQVKAAKKAKSPDLADLNKELSAKQAEFARAQKELSAKKAALTSAQATMKRNEKALARKKGSRDAFTMRKYAREGFLNLPKDLVTAMKGAGFKWGGDWKVHKDFMHFDMP
jgi:hypothetical protein